ncbi:hypothetical protein MPLDJ20_260018 [Mesorhizobium plurifarium]|uniref:Uncharacterized protein n=1 Tax=Mesorhizobium plurifarium TaxID=69974 RepID=A0A090FD47_MESPL|nr:hypothetical protein MPLDJ20_260018 [Mesorhizobium plurifarium]
MAIASAINTGRFAWHVNLKVGPAAGQSRSMQTKAQCKFSARIRLFVYKSSPVRYVAACRRGRVWRHTNIMRSSL